MYSYGPTECALGRDLEALERSIESANVPADVKAATVLQDALETAEYAICGSFHSDHNSAANAAMRRLGELAVNEAWSQWRLAVAQWVEREASQQAEILTHLRYRAKRWGFNDDDQYCVFDGFTAITESIEGVATMTFHIVRVPEMLRECAGVYRQLNQLKAIMREQRDEQLAGRDAGMEVNADISQSVPVEARRDGHTAYAGMYNGSNN